MPFLDRVETARWLGRLDRLLPLALRKAPAEARRRARLLLITAFCAGNASFVDALLGVQSGDVLRQQIFLTLGLALWALIPLLHVHRSVSWGGHLATGLILLTLAGTLLTGRSGYFLVIIGIVPVVASLLNGWRSGVFWAGLSCLVAWVSFRRVSGSAGLLNDTEPGFWSAVVAICAFTAAAATMEILKNGAVADAEASRRRVQKAYRQLEAEQERFRALAEKNYAVIAEVDLRGRLIYVNTRVRDLFGYRPNELIGRNHLELVHAEDIPLAVEAVKETMGKARGARLEVRARHKSGSWVWTEIMGSLYRTSAGEDRLIYAARDIGPEKLTRERLLEAQKLKSLGVLAGGIAHDFNNLLTVIQGYAALVEDPQVGGAIRRAAKRAGALTGQLLAFGRKQELQIQVVDLNSLVLDLEDMFRSLLREDVRLDMSLADGLWPVEADYGKMEQVLINLVTNARDAMPEGGSVHLVTKNCRINRTRSSVLGIESGEYASITIRDTGDGMDAATLERAFEPFFTTKDVGKGTGLGLSTVYGIVEQIGGGVHLESRPGSGTEVEVLLPRSGKSLARDVETPESQPLDTVFLGEETILVVEDEESVRQLVRLALERAGYTVLEAMDGAEALPLVERHGDEIALLITDVIMPGIRGPELAEKIRETLPDLKVLFISGYSDEEIGLLREERARVDFLPKPFKPNQLVRRVITMLEGARSAPAIVDSGEA